jgi:hypothetical protein
MLSLTLNIILLNENVLRFITENDRKNPTDLPTIAPASLLIKNMVRIIESQTPRGSFCGSSDVNSEGGTMTGSGWPHVRYASSIATRISLNASDMGDSLDRPKPVKFESSFPYLWIRW